MYQNSDIFSKYVGDPERKVAQLFGAAEKSKIIFVDEIEEDEAEAREKLFQLHLGKIPNTLTEEDFKTLGENTDGFSGSDIKNIVDAAKEGLFQKARASRYFKQVNVGSISRYLACDENDPDAIEMSFDQVPNGELALDRVTFDDVKNVVLGRKPSVSSTLLDTLDKFHENRGH